MKIKPEQELSIKGRKSLSIDDWQSLMEGEKKLIISTGDTDSIKSLTSNPDLLEHELLGKLVANYYYQILEIFNKTGETISEEQKIETSWELFYDFTLKNLFLENIDLSNLDNEEKIRFYKFITKFQQHYIENAEKENGVSVKLDGIYKKKIDAGLHSSDGAENIFIQKIRERISTEEVNSSEVLKQREKQITKIKIAYGLMIWLFKEHERYEKIEGTTLNKGTFSHLRSVTQKVIDNTDQNIPEQQFFDRILIALLHDTLEDIPGFPKQIIIDLFGQHIADSVEAISKKDRRTYDLTKEEEFSISQIDDEEKKYKEIKKRKKEKRDNEYYPHINELIKNGYEDALFVKMCDRLDNLESMDHLSVDHIIKKVQETEECFLTSDIKNSKFSKLTAELEIRSRYLKAKVWQDLKKAAKDGNNIISEIGLDDFKKKYCGERVERVRPEECGEIKTIISNYSSQEFINTNQ